jgi:hypothetical protein
MSHLGHYPDSAPEIKTGKSVNMRAPRGQSFIYIIQFATDNIVKVGIGEHPFGRLKALQTGAFSRLYLRHTYGPMNRDAARVIEAACHEVMAERGLCGEWFCVPLQAAVEVVSGQIEDYLDLEKHDCLSDFDPSVGKHFFELSLDEGRI